MSMRHQAGIVLPGYNALKVANAPTIGTATSASGTSVSVTFTAPACTGGGAISSYSAYCTTTGTNIATGASSPLVVTGLTTGTAYTFRVSATNAFGPSYPSAASNSATPTLVVGQQAYGCAGTFSWVAPTGVTSVSVVAVGAGGTSPDIAFRGGGGGGGLRYKNNITVIPGNSYTVIAGNVTSGTGGNSSFASEVTANGGNGSTSSTGGAGGTGTTIGGSVGGGNGGNGGNASCYGGGGGAAGYAGNGGTGATGSGNGTAGSGGGAGGGRITGSGGGVGILGQGCNGAGAVGCTPAGGGSGGANGDDRYPNNSLAIYGAGGGTNNKGARGAVRIIWPGTTRSFPSTCTGNL